MYQQTAAKEFLKKAKKFVKKNPQNQKRLRKTLDLLLKNPYSISLKTHKVNHRLCGSAFSSWVTGDVRIIWDFVDNKQKILLIDLGKLLL